MELIADILNYSLTAILIGVSMTWAFLIKSMIDSIRLTPYLDEFERKEHANPKVSIILPARNEEEFIGKCLDSLIEQDYTNYEIIVVDDSSDDATGKIISEYAKKNSKIIPVSAQIKPDGMDGEKLGMYGRIQKGNRRTIIIYRCRYKAFTKCNFSCSIAFTFF